MAVNFSPFGNSQIVDENGDIAVGWKLYSYVAGSSTPLATYTEQNGLTAQSNPIVINALGFPTMGQIWLTSGLSYKLVLTDANGVVKKTEDNITGVASALSASQWLDSGLTPTYISASSFTLVGDQTTAFHVGRRIKATVTAGTVYGTIISSAYSALTTIGVALDSGTLDSGLSAISYGLISKVSDSLPRGIFPTIPEVAGQIYGLTLSNNVTDAVNDIDIAAGVTTDSTATVMMRLASALTKRLDAAWAVGTGNGGLDTGAIANTTYHIFLIRKDSDGSIDALFSASATAPTMPAGYTYKRRIGSIIRASAAIGLFTQLGDEFLWKSVSTFDYNAATPITAISVTTRTPSGIQTEAILNAAFLNTSGAGFALYLTSLDQDDETATVGGTATRATCINPTTGVYAVSQVRIRTNASAQIRARSEQATNSTRISTNGYIDSRGQYA